MGDRIHGVVPLGGAIQRDLQLRIRTVIPATVVTYDAATTTATVQPAPMVRGAGGEYESEKPVQDAPVAFPQGGGWSISWALLPGDTVLLLVPDRPTEEWRVTGTTYQPSSGLLHSLSYAFVWPGAGPAPNPITGASATDFVIRGPSGIAFTVNAATGAITLGSNAAAPFAARVADAVAPTAAMVTWMSSVTSGINALAPGSVVPYADDAIGNISEGSAAVRIT